MKSIFASSELAGVRVLVAEDDDDGRDLLVELLSQLSVDVIAVSDGARALEAFARDRPQLILSDIYMPGVNGFAFLAGVRARSLDDGGLTPAIAMTAGADMEREALLGGFHAWFAKPLDLPKLFDALRSFAAVRAALDAPSTAPVVLHDGPRGAILASLAGAAHLEEVSALAGALRGRLDAPRAIAIDLRPLQQLDVAAPYVAQRALWDVRDRITEVQIVGGPPRARLALRGTFGMLGVRARLVDELE